MNLLRNGVAVVDGGTGIAYLGTDAGSVGILNIGNGSGAGTLQAAEVRGGAGSVTINFDHNSSNYIFNPIITGTTMVNVEAGTTVFNHAQTYSGQTSIDGGKLLVNNATGSGTGTGPVAVNTGGTLGGSGSIGGAVTLNNGGKIAPSTATPGLAGTTLHAGSMTWNGGGTLSLQLGATADELALNGALTKGTPDPLTSASLMRASLSSITPSRLSPRRIFSPPTSPFPARGIHGDSHGDGHQPRTHAGHRPNWPDHPKQRPGLHFHPGRFHPQRAGDHRGPTENNTINSLIFTPGGTLTISHTLTVTSGRVTTAGGNNSITGGTLFGPNGWHFDVYGNLFIGSTLIGNTTKTGTGSLFLDGTLLGNLQVLQGLLGGHGTINGNLYNDSVVSPGHSPGTLTVTRNYTQTSRGLLKIEIGGRDLASHDLLSVGGTAQLGGTLQLVRLDGFKLKRNKPVTFLTAASGVSGEFATVLNDFTSDTILEPTVVYHQNSVALEAVQGSFEKFAQSWGLTPNQNSVARALDSVAFNRQADSLINYLDDRKLTKLPGDFDRIAPEELTSIFTIGHLAGHGAVAEHPTPHR
ncbi:MAG: hypothetical protein WDN28_10545 [Chthoniobacter sp.]